MISETHSPATGKINAWQQHVEKLAWHAWQHYFNRDDAMGAYGDAGPYCHKLTQEEAEARKEEIIRRLRSHFAGKRVGGTYAQNRPDNGWLTKFFCIDIDLHADCPDKEERRKKNHYYAMHLLRKLEGLGFLVYVEDSNGRGGYHIWVRLDKSLPVQRVHAFLTELVADAKEHGLDDPPEVYPKAAKPTGEGFGFFIRLPAKHHTYDHWSRAWGEGEWLSGEESVEAWLSLPASDSNLIPELTESVDEYPSNPVKYTGIVDSTAIVDSIGALAEQTIESESWDSLLRSFGWKMHSSSGAESKWTRPGKDHGVSATLNYRGNNLLTVFSNAVPGLNAGDDGHETFGKWRFYCWSSGFENRQVDAAKAYLPEHVVQQFEARQKEQWKAQQQANRQHSADESRTNHGKQTAIVDKSKRINLKRDEFQSFPVHLLPETLCQFATETAAAVGCDTSFPALASLAVAAAAIGTSRQLCIKHGWFCPAVLWTALVGESGSCKSPPFRLATLPLKDRQARQCDEHIAEMTQYQDALRAYKREYKSWERSGEGDEPQAPEKPVRGRSIVSDVTVESLASILQDNPRGLLLGRDELSTWLAGFDRYSNKGQASSEVPRWLEIYGCESVTIDRKTGDEKFIFVRRPFVAITGGIQPGILSKVLTAEHKDSGLQARLLLAYPPRQPKRWRDEEISQQTLKRYSDCINGLFELQHDESSGEQRPATLFLTDDARQVFRNYVDRTGDEQSSMHGHVASQWSKLEEIPARLAIILHCVRQVTSGVEDHWHIDADTMQRAVELGEWFKTETLRINRALSEDNMLQECRALAEWIEQHGGRITARDLARLRRDIHDTDEAEDKLLRLVDLGFGTWSDIHKSREFVLHQSRSVDECNTEHGEFT